LSKGIKYGLEWAMAIPHGYKNMCWVNCSGRSGALTTVISYLCVVMGIDIDILPFWLTVYLKVLFWY
jgi:hypothetical protein